jgi:hypothetical protein
MEVVISSETSVIRLHGITSQKTVIFTYSVGSGRPKYSRSIVIFKTFKKFQQAMDKVQNKEISNIT